MPSGFTVPKELDMEYVNDLIVKWIPRLGLEQHRIATEEGDLDDNVIASTVKNGDYLSAKIIFSTNDTTSSDSTTSVVNWEETVVHELLHIAFSRMLDRHLDALMEIESPSARKISSAAFKATEERIIEGLMRALVKEWPDGG